MTWDKASSVSVKLLEAVHAESESGQVATIIMSLACDRTEIDVTCSTRDGNESTNVHS
jgi:hypothetical protein